MSPFFLPTQKDTILSVLVYLIDKGTCKVFVIYITTALQEPLPIRYIDIDIDIDIGLYIERERKRERKKERQRERERERERERARERVCVCVFQI